MLNVLNNLDFLKETYDMLAKAQIDVWIFGGWAEELHALIEPRAHDDIDLLYPSEDFSNVDIFLKKNNFKVVKEFPHKRAFIYKGVMVELFLVTNDITDFFSSYKHPWPTQTFTEKPIKEVRVCSVESLKDYREKHYLVEEAYHSYLK